MTVISASGIHKAYGSNHVLDGLDFDLHSGEALALLGPNGAGKTTTIEIILGFVARDSGSVAVLGQDPASSRDEGWRGKIGVAIQSGQDHPKWKVSEFLQWVRAHYEESTRLRSVTELATTFGLSDHLDKPLLNLSGGLRRRVDIAAAVINRPELLVLDEPTTGLDPAVKRAVHDVVVDQIDTGTALLLATHDLSEAERIADRILILNGGGIVAEGSPDALRSSVEGNAEVTWRQNGERHIHVSEAPEQFVHGILSEGGVTDLEVRRSSLEDAYLSLIDPEHAGPAVWRGAKVLTGGER